MNQIPTRFLTKTDLGKFVTTVVTKQGVTFVYPVRRKTPSFMAEI